jgi:SAM-dependent methyltransferase
LSTRSSPGRPPAGTGGPSDAVAGIVRQIERDDSLPGRMSRIVRLALPPNAAVVVTSGGDDALLDIGATWIYHFPRLRAEDTPHLGEGERLIKEVGLIAEQSAAAERSPGYLMVPAGAGEWLGQPFFRHMRAHYRLVVDEPETCVVFALDDLPPGFLESDPLPDGLPLPTPELIGLTSAMPGEEDIPGRFFVEGILDARAIRQALEDNGVRVRKLTSLLEFGCGCGRVIRHWRSLPIELNGSDYNPYLLGWCRENLTFANFTVNGVAPPLDYPEDSFDVVYAVSVFTHFLEPLQQPWAEEMRRVLRPGGHLLLTVNGLPQTWVLDEAQLAAFEAGEFVEIWADRAGTNICTAFHPERYLRETFAPSAGFELVDLRPDWMPGAHQDAVLLRNP